MENKDKQWLSWVLLIVLALLWGSSYILIKTALKSFTPFQVGSARMVLAFLLFAVPAFLYVRKVSFVKIKYITLVAVVGTLIPAFLYPIAQTRITSSLAGILNAVTPMFTLIIGALLFRYQFTLWKIIGLVLGLIGVVLLVVIQSNGSWGTVNVYAFFVILATILNAWSINIIKVYLQDVPSLILSSMTMLIISPIAGAYLFSTDFVGQLHFSTHVSYPFLALLFLGLINSGVTLVIYYRLLQISSPIFASSVTYLMPVVAILWGVMDGEQLTIMHYIGMVFILIGILVVNKSK